MGRGKFHKIFSHTKYRQEMISLLSNTAIRGIPLRVAFRTVLSSVILTPISCSVCKLWKKTLLALGRKWSSIFLYLSPCWGVTEPSPPSLLRLRAGELFIHVFIPHMLHKFQTQVTQGQVTSQRQVTSPHNELECSSLLHQLNEWLETISHWYK